MDSPPPRLTGGEITAAILNARSWAGVIKTLGLPIGGGSYTYLQQFARDHAVSTAHFTGQGWRKGITRASTKVHR